MISHHAIECLLQRVLLDDASTPVPLLWLGAHEPWWCWDGSSERRLLVSAVRLRDRMSTGKRLRHGAVAKGVMRPATCPVFLDSGAFSWIAKFGTWANWPAADFAAFMAHACRILGTVEHAGIQDWMCEADMLARTGLTVEEHQRRTVASYLELRKLAPQVPWVATLQGHTLADYLRCAQMYEDAGVHLAAWRDDFAPGGLMNSQAFAERWRVRQLARLCATIADAVDSTRNPEPMIYETHQIEMFTGEPHGAHP